MKKKFYLVIFVLLMLTGITSAAGGDGGQIGQTGNWKNTIDIKNPVKSPDELVTIIAASLDSVCATLNLSINNTGHWFDSDSGQLNECIDKALKKSLIGSHYYHGCTCNETSGIGHIIKLSIKFKYKFPRNTLLEYINDVETKAVDIINSVISPGMNDYQKEKALHDYIIKHATYDYENYQTGTIPDESYTPYGVLVLGIGVCDGYTQAMELLSNKAGLACMTVSGTGDGGPHSWNIIKIEGEYYHLDVTWDDPVNADKLSYNYFNLTDDLISVNHSWDKDSYPKCESVEYNYFNVNDLLASNMNECQLRIKNAITSKQKSICLKVLNFNKSTFQRDIQSILSKFLSKAGFTWYCYENLGIVEIECEYSK